MELCGTGNIAQKARDAKAHICWIAKRRQDQGCNTYDCARDNDPDIKPFHIYDHSFPLRYKALKRNETLLIHAV